MCCKSKCCGGRDCCAPIIPPNDKAKGWRIALIVVLVLHAAVLVLKCVLMGIGSGITDLVAIIILIIALVRFDYCQVLIYVVINLFEVFALIVVLGYYLQTDMGKNVPNKKSEPAEDPPPDNGDKGGDNNSATGNKHSMGLSIKHHGGKKSNAVNLVLRGLFDKFLKLKYNFYQVGAHEESGVKSAGPADDHQNIQLDTDKKDDDDDNKLSKKHGPTFIICFCTGLILFYIIASILAHCAYREFKGIAEDCAGGSVNVKDANILHYAIIDKREEDAIEQREKEERKRRERGGMAPEGMSRPNGMGDQAPMMQNMDDVV